jgi:hypothetical protein
MNKFTRELAFPGTMEAPEGPPNSTLTREEITVLSDIINAIIRDNYNEVMMRIVYDDGKANVIYAISDKLNDLREKP